MLDPAAWDQVADVLVPEDFYRADHRLIYAAIGALVENRQPCDAVVLSEYLDNRGELEQVGGLGYLATLANESPSATNVRAYATVLRERSMLRALISAGNEIAGSAFATEGRTASELVDEAERRVFEIAEKGQRAKSGLVPLKSLLPAVIDEIDLRHKSDGTATGLSSGFKDFDKLTTGLQPSDLIIVAGRPSMGKTTFAVNIAESAAIQEKTPVAIYSMEMSAEQLAFRMIASLGQVNQTKLRTGEFEQDDWNSINSAVQLMTEAPIYIDDTPALSPTELRARARRLKRQHDVGLVVVDYLQLMQVQGTSENRATEISEISRSLKALAKELNVPVIALSQLNRSVEQRQDKRPVMSDLRESGAIEQDADLIVFIYREEVYNPETTRKRMADIILAKQRNGPIGDVTLTFQGEFTRFRDFVPDMPFEAPSGW